MKSFKEFVGSSLSEGIDVQRKSGHFDGALKKELAKRVGEYIQDEDPNYKALYKMVQNTLPKEQVLKSVRLAINGSELQIKFVQKPEIYKNYKELDKLGKKLEQTYKTYLKELGIFDNVKVEIKYSSETNSWSENYFSFQFKVTYDLTLKNVVIPRYPDGSGEWK